MTDTKQTPESLMVAVVGDAVSHILDKNKDLQLNLNSETTRIRLATQVTDHILRVMDRSRNNAK